MRDVHEADALGKFDVCQDMKMASSPQQVMRDIVLPFDTARKNGMQFISNYVWAICCRYGGKNTKLEAYACTWDN